MESIRNGEHQYKQQHHRLFSPNARTINQKETREIKREKKTSSLRIHRLITYFQAYYYGLPQELIKHKIFKYVSGERAAKKAKNE